MNRRLISPLLLASLLATAAFAASAQSSTASADAAGQAQAADASVGIAFDASAKPEIDRYCLRQTGSRIVARDNSARYRSARESNRKSPRCVAAHGRVYSREDLQRTGHIDIADALRKLDPSIY